MSRYRKPMGRKQSKRDFTRKAVKIARPNVVTPMRGGIRM